MLTILFEFAWEVIKENRRAYLALNGLFYGLLILSMIYAAIVPAVQSDLLKSAGDSSMTGTVALIGKGYAAGDILSQIVRNFFGNILGSNFVDITLVSLVVPFGGVLTGLYHAVFWGLLFSPADPAMRTPMVMHWLSLALESQANILGMLGAYILGRGVIWPQTIGVTSRKAGYLEGLRQAGALYTMIVLVLAAAAIYGMIEVGVMSQVGR